MCMRFDHDMFYTCVRTRERAHTNAEQTREGELPEHDFPPTRRFQALENDRRDVLKQHAVRQITIKRG